MVGVSFKGLKKGHVNVEIKLLLLLEDGSEKHTLSYLYSSFLHLGKKPSQKVQNSVFYEVMLNQAESGRYEIQLKYGSDHTSRVTSLQYVVLGPRVKVINLNILPESTCNELKYSLKIAFMFLSIILKFQVPDINILLGIRKKATVFDGPWSASQVSSTIKT